MDIGTKDLYKNIGIWNVEIHRNEQIRFIGGSQVWFNSKKQQSKMFFI